MPARIGAGCFGYAFTGRTRGEIRVHFVSTFLA
jgi:hypothetical protein